MVMWVSRRVLHVFVYNRFWKMSTHPKDQKQREDLLQTLSPPTLSSSASTNNRKLKLQEDLMKEQDLSHMDLVKNCFVVAVSGGDCSGKKLLMNAIAKELQKKNVTMAVLQQEGFYKESYTASDVSPSGKKGSIFTPENTDWAEFERTLRSMVVGNKVTVKKYDFMAQKLLPTTLTIEPSPLVLVTGLHIFTSKVIRNLSDVSVFIEADADVRLSRRIYQDTMIRKIPIDDSVRNYLENIKPAFEKFTEPTKKFVDLVIPHFGGGYSNNYDDILSGGFESEESRVGTLLVHNIFATMRQNETIKTKKSEEALEMDVKEEQPSKTAQEK